jgi:hypothetical protein
VSVAAGLAGICRARGAAAPGRSAWVRDCWSLSDGCTGHKKFLCTLRSRSAYAARRTPHAARAEPGRARQVGAVQVGAVQVGAVQARRAGCACRSAGLVRRNRESDSVCTTTSVTHPAGSTSCWEDRVQRCSGVTSARVKPRARGAARLLACALMGGAVHPSHSFCGRARPGVRGPASAHAVLGCPRPEAAQPAMSSDCETDHARRRGRRL